MRAAKDYCTTVGLAYISGKRLEIPMAEEPYGHFVGAHFNQLPCVNLR